MKFAGGRNRMTIALREGVQFVSNGAIHTRTQAGTGDCSSTKTTETLRWPHAAKWRPIKSVSVSKRWRQLRINQLNSFCRDKSPVYVHGQWEWRRFGFCSQLRLFGI